tara:strand:- start:295 stop:942 length:648 start_codon:yes stop_codon:yes gene_type:complete
MNDNLIEAQYEVSKKSKIRRFYDTNKIFIYSFIFILIISLVSFSFYLGQKNKKKIEISENYIQAKIYLGDKKNSEALSLLKNIIFANDQTYSVLSLFMILDQDLIKDPSESLVLFNHVLDNNKFDKEIKNLLIFKKALFSSSQLEETQLINELKPLLNAETMWKAHALLLLGDYFVSKKEYIKARDFYSQILSINNLQQDLYDQAKLQLELIANN